MHFHLRLPFTFPSRIFHAQAYETSTKSAYKIQYVIITTVLLVIRIPIRAYFYDDREFIMQVYYILCIITLKLVWNDFNWIELN